MITFGLLTLSGPTELLVTFGYWLDSGLTRRNSSFTGDTGPK